MKIAIDIDDTLSNTTNYLFDKALVYDKEKCRGKGVIFNGPFSDKFDWTKEEYKEFYETYLAVNALNFQPMKNASIVTHKLHNMGFFITITTARNNNEFNNPFSTTKQWLNLNNIYYDNIEVNCINKGSFIIENKFDVFVDDSKTHCDYVFSNSNIVVIRFGEKVNLIDNNYLVSNDWDDIYKYIKERFN